MNTTPVILIVDDQPENLATLSEVLEPHYRVIAANSGRRALQLANVQPRPDLVLLDFGMPDMNGEEVLTALRNAPETRNIPVIFVTARDSDLDEELGLRLGAADYVTKPIRPAILLARVLTQLENKHARDILHREQQALAGEVASRTRDNEIIQDASVHALAILAETRDNDTGNHIRRTRAYVGVLVEALAAQGPYAAELTPQRQKLIVRAAPLHDIGKVGVPDEILLKPGKLTPEERTIIQTHARIGGDAIDAAISRARDGEWGAAVDAESHALDFLVVAREIAVGHHERWDGAGYPDRLAGNAIPLSARIMAVADVYDALISRRVYKTPYTHADACNHLLAGKGSHFDPVLIDAFIELNGEFDAIARRYRDPG